jgi:hypothetical protein
MRNIALTAGLSVLLAAAALQAQAVTPGLDGAWRVMEISTPGSVDRGPPQPGLLLIFGGYYSYTLVTAEGPRPDVSGGLSTAEDLLAAWSPFTANAGTLEVSGSTMLRRPIVAKSPDAMGPGLFNEYTFRLSADTLWVTTVGTESGRSRNPSTVRYRRLP